jgi:hypothetical protein
MIAEGTLRRKTPRKAVKDPAHGVNHQLHRPIEHDDVSSILQAYLDERTDVVVYVGWARREGPSVDVCMRFHSAKSRRIPKTVLGLVPWEHDVVLCRPYKMQVPMLVRVVPGAQLAEPKAGVGHCVAPSYVWLKVMERASLSFRQTLDPGTVRIESGSVGIDRELCPPFDFLGHLATEMPDMQLIGQMVKRRPEIEENLSKDESPLGVDIRQLAEIETVLQSMPVFFEPNGPSFEWRPSDGDLLLERLCVIACPSHLGMSTLKRPAHDVAATRAAAETTIGG